mmetsp:Transcript_9199/g.19940  ORF Transcript_9199/g.19940 Transcript_9199/m.19940 type:complete len:369 (-) Transcript_9199:1749-2855(-)
MNNQITMSIREAMVSAVFLLLLLDHAQESSALSIRDKNRANSSRRGFVEGLAIATATALILPEQAHATRAVGGAEIECRAAGNCLEKLELDGALGWNWGAKDRCDATDPNCGSNGRVRDSPLVGEKVPDRMGYSITHVVQMSLAIGRSNEDCIVRMGLYGNDVAASVEELVNLLSPTGLKTTSDLVFESGMGVAAIPVSLTRGGILAQIVPGQRLDFGIPLQSAAYARSKGMANAGDNFVSQPRPRELKDVPVLRKHDAAGLVSIPAKGIGYGGSGYELDDACFESSFQITASATPGMDKENRRVIGQLLDDESMENLARLVSLPTKKGFRGVIPGQNSGPPLIKVVLADIQVGKVKSKSSEGSLVES